MQVQGVYGSGPGVARYRPRRSGLGWLRDLPGIWQSLPGHGWNMIALPFADAPYNYRLLLNQYDEELEIRPATGGLPNRGIRLDGSSRTDDRRTAALHYRQTVTQAAAADYPASGQAAAGVIHHETGQFLHFCGPPEDRRTVARLAAVPHGSTVLALGRGRRFDGAPRLPQLPGLPEGLAQHPGSDCLRPYLYFHETPFLGQFDPLCPQAQLARGLEGLAVRRTVELRFDTSAPQAGILNTPFVEQQASPDEFQAVYWIEELEDRDGSGAPVLQLQYAQTVMLSFFPRTDGTDGLIRWPHVSVNTLRRVAGTEKGD